MKTATQKTLLILTTAALSIILSSCGVKKSSEQSSTSIVQPSYSPASKILASCSKQNSSDMSVSISAVRDQASGKINTNWAKIKFNQLSTATRASGNTIRFFKWKATDSQIVYDYSPLQASQYNLTTKEFSNTATSSIVATDITLNDGFYLNLQDESGTYQVLMIVVYNTNGSIVSKTNILIPQFSAVPADYSYNSDGSIRAQNLQDLHPLKSTNTSDWTTSQYASYFNSFCF